MPWSKGPLWYRMCRTSRSRNECLRFRENNRLRKFWKQLDSGTSSPHLICAASDSSSPWHAALGKSDVFIASCDAEFCSFCFTDEER